MRQGCPLSPYLFVLSVEVLANATRRDPSIKGISISQNEIKLLSQYAHDTTLILDAGLLVRRGKKSQISRDFQGQIRGKNGRFRGNFAGIFEASFAEKRL